jgi:hypothetical protein
MTRSLIAIGLLAAFLLVGTGCMEVKVPPPPTGEMPLPPPPGAAGVPNKANVPAGGAIKDGKQNTAQ